MSASFGMFSIRRIGSFAGLFRVEKVVKLNWFVNWYLV